MHLVKSNASVSSYGAFRVVLKRRSNLDTEEDLTGCVADNWADFKKNLSNWLDHKAVRNELQDRDELMVVRGEEECWYLIIAVAHRGWTALRFLELTTQDQQMHKAARAMATANVYDPGAEERFRNQSADLEQRIGRIETAYWQFVNAREAEQDAMCGEE